MRLADRHRSQYQEVTDPQEGDVILMRSQGHPIHVGYCIDQNLMLHSEEGAESTVEQWNGTKWKNRVVGVFRYVGAGL